MPTPCGSAQSPTTPPPTHVRRAAPDRLDQLEALYAPLRTANDATDDHRLLDRARRALQLVDDLPTGKEHAQARQHARVVAAALEYRTTQSLATADRSLAETTIWWHEHTGAKLVYWGGLGHTANAKNRTFSPPPSTPEPNAGTYPRDTSVRATSPWPDLRPRRST